VDRGWVAAGTWRRHERTDSVFEVLVPFPTPLQAPRDLLPPVSWLTSTVVNDWLRTNKSIVPHGIRQQGGLLLSVMACDLEAAVQFAAERVELFSARVLLSTRKQVEHFPLAWVRGKTKSYSIERRLRGIRIGATHRENRIWFESEPDPYIDPAIELLALLQSGSASAATRSMFKPRR
jgi:hypothetical protein